MSQAEGGLVTIGERCTSSDLVCLWGWSGKTQDVWRELCLVGGLVLGMHAGDRWNPKEREC